MSKPKLPSRLHAAYNWVDAAGELDECRDDPGYPAAAAANAIENGETDVTESDLRDLAEWLKANRPAAPPTE